MPDDAIREALEDAMLDVFDGSPPGPLLAGQVHRTAVEVLRRLGIRARVQVSHGGQRLHVGLQERDRVRTVVLTFQPL